MSTSSFCSQCGNPIDASHQFCPKCGAAVTPARLGPQVPSKPSPVSGTLWGIPKGILIVALIVLVLIVPVIPRQRVIYVNGTTQTVTQSTSYSTSYRSYTTSNQISIKVYKGSLQYVTDQYYQYYQQYYYQCYWDQYGNYDCYYQYWPNYQSYTYTVTIDPTDEIVKMDQTNESGGLVSITLTHYDGTQDIYRHVFSTDMTKSATATVQAVTSVTDTITNSIVSPVTNTVPCENCIAQTVTDHVSILQILLGY